MQLPPAAAPRVQPWGAASQPRARRRAQVAEAAAAEGVGAAELAARVAALCADTTCCTVVALDADERPLRPALLWMDARSAPQACTLAAAPPPSLLLPLPVSLLYAPSVERVGGGRAVWARAHHTLAREPARARDAARDLGGEGRGVID